MNQPLLIIGASARAAAQSAHRAGFRVLAADLFADRDLVEITESTCTEDYPNDFAKITKELSGELPDLAVMYTGAIENYPDVVAEIETQASLFGNSSDVLRSVRDPFVLQDVFRRHAIPFARSQQEPPNDFDSRCWLRKNFSSAGGLRVQLADASDEASDDHFFQERIEGVVCSAAFVSDGSRAQLIGVSEMLVGVDWLGADGFKYCGSLTRSCSTEELARWQTIANVMCHEFGIVGLFGVDAVMREDKVVPIEVNPRYTASMELFESEQPEASACSLVRQHLDACLRRPIATISSHCEKTRAKCILYATEAINFPDYYSDLRSPGIEIADVPQPQCIEAGHPVLTILAESSSRERVIETMKVASERIRNQLAKE